MRNLEGVGGGVGVVNRMILTEVCGRRHLIRGFSLFSPAIEVGVTIG